MTAKWSVQALNNIISLDLPEALQVCVFPLWVSLLFCGQLSSDFYCLCRMLWRIPITSLCSFIRSTASGVPWPHRRLVREGNERLTAKSAEADDMRVRCTDLSVEAASVGERTAP